ncbi:MAG: hypothetical protein KDN19_16040 [Verrucomicrobiae bacterium]|nr:hypothetical protein [Verrucomicrobiae bacterium]
MKVSSVFSRLLICVAGMLALVMIARADTVKLKSGQTLEGKITAEGSDFIKLEIPVSATIKDTKIIPRGDIAQIIKAAPDDVALSELRKKLPAPSLMSAEAYRSLIDSGPKKFLEQYPSSTHKAEVEKMLADLQSELDKVERGYLKVEGEWISPQEKQQFKTLTDSRIRGVSFKRKVAAGDQLGALRDFEILDEQYFGTPAHVEAIPVVKELLPAFGQRLTRALQDVEYRKQKWEEDKGLLDEVARAQVEAARAQEIANFERAVEREKEAGIKWLSINDNSADSLTGSIGMVKSEIETLKSIDVATMNSMSEELVKADKLIAEKKLGDAKKTIAEATAMIGNTGKKGTSSTGKKSSSKGKSPSSPSSYASALLSKIAETETAMELARQQEASAAKGVEASKTITEAGAAAAEKVNTDLGEASTDKKEEVDQGSALTSLMGVEAKEKEEKKVEKKTPTKKSTASKDDEGEEMKRPEPVVADEGGGINFQLIMMIVAGLMVVAIVVMKVLGIGGKKESAE